MALATTCPQCKTSFKVVPDQLKLRKGLVRCGVCQHVFSGIDHLRYVDDAVRTAQRIARERAAAAKSPAEVAPTGSHGVSPGSTAAASTADGASASPDTWTAVPASRSAAPLPAGPAVPASIQAIVGADADAATTAVPMTDTAAAAVPMTDAAAADAPAAAAALPAEAPTAARAEVPVAPPAVLLEESQAAAPVDTPTAATPAANWPAEVVPFDAPAVRTADTARPTRPSVVGPEREGTPPPADLPIPPAPGASIDSGTFRPPFPLPVETTAALGAPEPGALAPAASGAGSDPASAPPLPVRPAAMARAVETPVMLAPPALPAPEAPAGAAPFPIGHLTDRPSSAWPLGSGPRTIPAPDEDLKTAFFLPDTAFGPLPQETTDSTGAHDAPPSASAAATQAPGTVPRPGAAPGPSGLALRPEGPPTRLFDEDGDLQRTLVRRSDEGSTTATGSSASESAIDFFPGQRTRSRSLGLALSPAAWAAAAALTLTLGLQALVGWRDAIAARVPLAAPTIAALLEPFGLKLSPPRTLDALTIESFELQAAAAPNVLQLSAVLRNRGDRVVGYPAMELTLTDSAGGLLVRKVITAEAYLADARSLSAGLAARSERPIRLALEHGGLQPTGYAVALFYP
jgi:predicted Zn finger-like uncharacterized protein